MSYLIRRILLAIMFLSLSCPTFAQAKAPGTTAAKPILVLREGLNGAINEWSSPAKFVLYDNNVAYIDMSNETSEAGDEPRYYASQLTPAESRQLIESLGVRKIMGATNRTYGKGAGPQNEGVQWRLIYWAANKVVQTSVIGSLDEAPANVAKLIKRLENYPRRDKRYLNYDYLIDFHNSPVQAAIAWPQSWTFVKFSAPMLAGQYVEGVYQYHLDAAHALELKAKLAKAHTTCVSVQGHVWRVTLTADPRLPDDALWAH